MITPVRLQLSRRKGSNLQALSRAVNGLTCVNVARPSLYGNPFKAKDAIAAGYTNGNKMAAWAFDEWMRGAKEFADYEQPLRTIILNLLPELRDKNVACWCDLCGAHSTSGKPLGVACSECAPCHGDCLLLLGAVP